MTGPFSSCRSAIANQVYLGVHTATYWLMLTVRHAIPSMPDLAKAEFTLRLRPIKIAPGSLKPQASCASPSQPLALRPICSAACPWTVTAGACASLQRTFRILILSAASLEKAGP